MKDLREEIGTKACIVGKIVKNRTKWAGHMVRMKYDKLPKRSETKKQEGFRKRGRLQLTWEDCTCEERSEKGRGARKVERKGQQQGPMETNYKRSRSLTPTQGKPDEEQHSRRQPVGNITPLSM